MIDAQINNMERQERAEQEMDKYSTDKEAFDDDAFVRGTGF